MSVAVLAGNRCLLTFLSRLLALAFSKSKNKLNSVGVTLSYPVLLIRSALKIEDARDVNFFTSHFFPSPDMVQPINQPPHIGRATGNQTIHLHSPLFSQIWYNQPINQPPHIGWLTGD